MKIYQRPESKMPSPLVMVIAVLVLAVIGYFGYRAFFHAAPNATTGTPGNAPSIIVPLRFHPVGISTLEMGSRMPHSPQLP